MQRSRLNVNTILNVGKHFINYKILIYNNLKVYNLKTTIQQLMTKISYIRGRYHQLYRKSCHNPIQW